MDAAYHFPPDFLDLLVETIPRLSKSKKTVLLFFEGAGVPRWLIADLHAAVLDGDGGSKFEIARTTLKRLNEGQDAYIAQRREIVKRVIGYEDFASSWPDDQLKAKGLVASVREQLNAKDTFTRMRMAHDAERAQRLAPMRAREAAEAHRRSEIEAVRRNLFAQFGAQDPHKRGIALQDILNRLFRAYGVAVREAFALTGDCGAGIVEQIDGVISFEGEIYLVEMKWWEKRLGPGEVAQHIMRLFGRGEARGIFIAGSGYTEGALDACRSILNQRLVVLCTLTEIVSLLEANGDLTDFLRRKIEAAVIDRNPFHRIGDPAA